MSKHNRERRRRLDPDKAPVIAVVPHPRSASLEDHLAAKVSATDAMLETIAMTARRNVPTGLLCPPVGTVEHPIPGERFEIVSCSRCGRQLWATARLKEALEKRAQSVEFFCNPPCWD
jgi:hypothetical protein